MSTRRVPWAEHDDRPRDDHFVHLRDVSWDDYERVLQIRGDKSAPRITYLEGCLEIMTPSRPHESIKSAIGCLVEVWCLERGIEFSTYGSWTLRDQRVRRGAEPDECYVFGEVVESARPHLAIEVVWTSGGIDKLEVYRKLGVREVWFWRKGRLQPYGLCDEQYEPLEGSAVLPALDLDPLASFIDRPTTSQSIREYRTALQTEA